MASVRSIEVLELVSLKWVSRFRRVSNYFARLLLQAVAYRVYISLGKRGAGMHMLRSVALVKIPRYIPAFPCLGRRSTLYLKEKEEWDERRVEWDATVSKKNLEQADGASNAISVVECCIASYAMLR